MDKLECIRLFQNVARTGSFTATANELNMSQGAVSKKIAWLESDLGFSLFHRSSRKIKLTDTAEQYLSFSQEFIERMALTEQHLKNELKQVVGTLKISAPSAFATQKLALPIKQFMAQNPLLKCYISVNDHQVDLYKDDIDVAIRVSHLKDSRLKAKKLIDHELCFFASQNYLAQHGTPKQPSELVDHSCLTYSLSNPSNAWYLGGEKVIVKESISSDSPEMIVEMALLGAGIGAMPKWMVQEYCSDKRLIELFNKLDSVTLPMYAVYKSSDYLPYRIRAFVDFLSDYFLVKEGAD